ncbi:MAG: cupin domain-containing protein [Rhodospirillales bacterium]|jgi:hypothetical protein|nr:cupin domain-containing protein [Rhodospirillales bacterium]MDP6644844.1 cupin domain-containing protein [Rhodospirillales bacterium]|tara:strand:+ start:353 stop:910 length:558 start_codon:yes stop_codon:yes gene_type:complete
MTVTAKSVRRVVAANDDRGMAVAIQDGPSPDVRTDPARPGFVATRLWVTDGTPARTKGVTETLDEPHTIEPPAKGSVFRYYEFPPDAGFIGGIGEDAVRAYFDAMGSPGACTYGPDAPHPYMQKSRALDYCYVIEGEITLVLDTGEVDLKEGDVVVQRGTNHAWSNRSGKPAVVVVSSHAAAEEQ